MSDWLEEIKEAYYDTTCDPEIELSPKAIERLISEVERLRERERNLKKQNSEQEKALWRATRRLNHEKEARDKNIKEIERLRAENKELHQFKTGVLEEKIFVPSQGDTDD